MDRKVFDRPILKFERPTPEMCVDGSAENLSGIYRRYATRLCELASQLISQRLGRQYSHEDAVELADAIETALANFKPRHVEICRLFYQEGMGVVETATSAGRSRWTVRRVLERFSQQLEIRLGDPKQQ